MYHTDRSMFINSIYAYLLEGAIVVILNVPLTITMILMKKIRSRREFQAIPPVYRSECTTLIFVQLMTISYQMQGILSLVVAFDRFLAVTLPIKYVKLGNCYHFIIIASMFI
ncbi:hypothetical protein COOONC_06207 [Cooperia oncophora]